MSRLPSLIAVAAASLVCTSSATGKPGHHFHESAWEDHSWRRETHDKPVHHIGHRAEIQRSRRLMRRHRGGHKHNSEEQHAMEDTYEQEPAKEFVQRARSSAALLETHAGADSVEDALVAAVESVGDGVDTRAESQASADTEADAGATVQTETALGSDAVDWTEAKQYTDADAGAGEADSSVADAEGFPAAADLELDTGGSFELEVEQSSNIQKSAGDPKNAKLGAGGTVAAIIVAIPLIVWGCHNHWNEN